ncbi:hypothetical protein GCM10011611_27230 [Aliidongia dinghuensis]|uniref:Uncharacterized protein n=1 Tax=Aliidongia dinghuensis TaxID=1867774 RepID=A0A8J2YTJ7_9PROT|nr:hypothetical protein [Aliidongia dinghuensis]GGF19797.1 hypothetical protein GCM10011611_27230 [Aliidongia dinghuensis]
MTIAISTRRSGSYGLRNRAALCIAPVAALIYPFTLKLFNFAVTARAASDGSASDVALAAFALFLSFALPAATLVSATRLAELEMPTAAQLRAKRIAIFSVAAPTIFVFIGVLLYMAGDPIPDTWAWVAFWAVLTLLVLRADNGAPAILEAKPIAAALRVAHGIAALAIILIFLGFHLTNHLAGLSGPEAHTAFQKVVRHVYRARIVEPLLVALFFFQVGSGLYFAFRHMAKPMDRFRAFQVASGMYLAFYVVGHMDSVFIFARTYLGIDTGWGFATGAPTGLVKDAWNIRLVPHCALGVFFVLAHLAAGLRVVLLAHGMRKETADRVMIGGAATGGLVAALIILAMCGMRLQFA